MQARYQPVLESKRAVCPQELEICFEVLSGVEAFNQLAAYELVKVGTVVVEPRVDVSGWTRFERMIYSKPIDRHVRESLLRELPDVILPVEVPCVPQASDEEVTQVP